MCLVYFQNMTGTSFQLVPYRGAAPAMQDLMAGQIDLSCLEAGQTLPHYRSGNIRAFGVLTGKRWFAAPDAPTIDEAGVPGLYMSFWHGVWASKGTPKEIVAKLNAAVVTALADAGVRQRFTDQATRFHRASNRRRRRSPPTTRPRPRNGGRSSRTPNIKAQ